MLVGRLLRELVDSVYLCEYAVFVLRALDSYFKVKFKPDYLGMTGSYQPVVISRLSAELPEV